MDARKAPWAIFAIETLAASGCYADLGPQIGLSMRDGRGRLGWELGAATFSVGQTYRIGGAAASLQDSASAPPDAPPAPPPDAATTPSPDVRTYVVWEPRIGSTSQVNSLDSIAMYGGGVTAGIQWDTMIGYTADSTRQAHTSFGGVFGLFGGAAYVPPNRNWTCQADVRPFYSIAIGVRGDEIYLSPKVGVVDIPHFCLDLSGL